MTDQQARNRIVPELIRDLWSEAQQTIGRTENHVREFSARLVEKGAVTQDEATKAFSETLTRLQNSREEMTVFMDGSLEQICRMLRIPTRQEVEIMRSRVVDLQKRVEALSAQVR